MTTLATLCKMELKLLYAEVSTQLPDLFKSGKILTENVPKKTFHLSHGKFVKVSWFRNLFLSPKSAVLNHCKGSEVVLGRAQPALEGEASTFLWKGGQG